MGEMIQYIVMTSKMYRGGEFLYEHTTDLMSIPFLDQILVSTPFLLNEHTNGL